MPVENEPQKIRLTLSPQAERYARRDAPVEVRRMAARGALPLPPVEIATVLFVLLHDPDTEVKTRAGESLEKLPEAVLTSVTADTAAPAPLLSHLAKLLVDRPAVLEPIALNPATDDATIAFLASLPHKRIVEIVSNNQERMLRCPEIVDALGSNPLTGRAVIDRILSFLGLERPAAEVVEEDDDLDLPPAQEITDSQAEAALRAVLSDDVSEFDTSLIQESDAELTEEEQKSLYARIQEMTVMQKVKLARMGNGEARGILIRDRNKVVSAAAIRSPRIKDSEVAQFARMRNLPEEVMRIISSNREWTKSYPIKLALAMNPKCPLSSAMKFLNHLQERDLKSAMRSKDVPTPIATHARRILQKKGKI